MPQQTTECFCLLALLLVEGWLLIRHQHPDTAVHQVRQDQSVVDTPSTLRRHVIEHLRQLAPKYPWPRQRDPQTDPAQSEPPPQK